MKKKNVPLAAIGIALAVLVCPSLSAQSDEAPAKSNPCRLSLGKAQLLSFDPNGMVLEVETNGEVNVTSRIAYDKLPESDLRQLVRLPAFYAFLTEFTNNFDIFTDDPQFAVIYKKVGQVMFPEQFKSDTAPRVDILDAGSLKKQIQGIWSAGRSFSERIDTRVKLMSALNRYQNLRNKTSAARINSNSYHEAVKASAERHDAVVVEYNKWIEENKFNNLLMPYELRRRMADARQQYDTLVAGRSRQQALLAGLEAQWRDCLKVLDAFGFQFAKDVDIPPSLPRFKIQEELDNALGTAPAPDTQDPGNSAKLTAETQSAGLVAKLNESAMLGDVAAQYQLGLCYLEGKGVAKDVKRAMDCFRAAAAGGNSAAKAALVRLLEEDRP